MDTRVRDTGAAPGATRRVSLRSLRTFCVAARHLSFKLAAEELFISPSAVSHQVRDLETHLDARLFERQTRSLLLTAHGRALFDEVEPLLRRIHETIDRFGTQPRRRTLRLALMPFFATELFIPSLHLFVAENPMVDLRIETTAVRLTQHRADADASILLSKEPPAGLVARPLCPLRLIAACAPSLKAALGNPGATQLAGDPSVTLIVSRSHPDSWDAWFRAAGVERSAGQRILNLDNTAAVALAAERGLGVALLPMPTGGAWLRSGALHSITGDPLVTGERYFLVYRPEDAERAEMRALSDWALRQFAGLA
jgi:LysR family glycine cleavage system transcriptional activator